MVQSRDHHIPQANISSKTPEADNHPRQATCIDESKEYESGTGRPRGLLPLQMLQYVTTPDFAPKVLMGIEYCCIDGLVFLTMNE
jgi:hypothetical protein